MSELASIGADGWELESAVQRNLAAPATFSIPPESERESLRVGQAAKLIFRIRVEDELGSSEIVTERMWVFVTARTGLGYEGRLQSRSQATPDFEVGTPVRFLSEHIADIADPPADFRPL